MAVGHRAFQIDERRLGFVQASILVRKIGIELPHRFLLGLKFCLFGGEDGIDLLELSVE